VEIPGKIDNSDQDSAARGPGTERVAREIMVKDIDTRCLRTARHGPTGRSISRRCRRRATTPPTGPTHGGQPDHDSGLLVSTNNWTSDLYGQISSESVILRLESNASLRTAANKLTLNVGKIRPMPPRAIVCEQSGAHTPRLCGDWSGTIAPVRPTLWFGARGRASFAALERLRFFAQQNTSLSNPAGWAARRAAPTCPQLCDWRQQSVLSS